MLLSGLAETTFHRLHASDKVTSLAQGVFERLRYTFTCCAASGLEPVPEHLQITLDLQLHGDGRLRVPLFDGTPGVLELLLQLGLADLVGSLSEFSRGLRVVAAGTSGGLVEPALEVLHDLVHLILPLP